MHKKGTLKYSWHNWYARQRQTKCKIDLTRDEFCQWWGSTGKLDQRGRDPAQYCMSLIDYTKPYSIDNIECITNQAKHDKQSAKFLTVPVRGPDGTEYASITEAMKATKSSRWLIADRLRNKKGWVFV